MDLDDKICYCFHVSKRKIVNYLRIHQPRIPSQLSECGGAGTGCGWCIPYLKRYFEAARSGQNAKDPIAPGDYARQRADYIRSGTGTPPAGATPLPEFPTDPH